MAVMFLRARVPNEGAHRLAWTIGTSKVPALAIRELESRLGVNTVDRLLEGSLTPSASEGEKISAWSRGEVRAGDFYRDTALSWGDRPAPRNAGAWRLPMTGRSVVRGTAHLRSIPRADTVQASA